MVAPPDNDVLWARSLHLLPQRLARARRCLARRPRGRDPRRHRPARQRQDDPAALPVRPAACPSRARSGSTASPCTPWARWPANGCAATGSAGSTPSPDARPRAERLGERRPAAACCAAPAPGRQEAAALEWLERLDIGDLRPQAPARPAPGRAPAGRHRPRAGRRRRRCSSPTSRPRPLHRADRAHVLRTLTTAARSHGITVVLATHDAEVAAARRPHGGAAATAAACTPSTCPPCPPIRKAGRRARSPSSPRGPPPRPAPAAAGRRRLRRHRLPAAVHPGLRDARIPTPRPRSVLRLRGASSPLAATVYFAVAVARTDPEHPAPARPVRGRPRPGAADRRLAAVSTAVSTTLGSMLALLFFLHLRGDLTGMPFDGAAAEFLGRGHPVAAGRRADAAGPGTGGASATASAVALRSRPDRGAGRPAAEERAGARPGAGRPPVGCGAGGRRAGGRGVRVPGRGRAARSRCRAGSTATPLAVLAGWTLAAAAWPWPVPV